MACAICLATSFQKRVSINKTDYIQCLGCGVVYQHSFPLPKQIEEIYNQDDNHYFVSDTKNADFVEGEEWLRATSRFFISRLKGYSKQPLETSSVLDFGCGTGITLSELQKLGSTCTGVEMSPWACRYGRERFGLTMLNEDIMNVHLEPESFDIILMSHVIEHLPNPVEIVSRLATFLKPGGTLMVCTPNNASLGARIFGRRWLYYLPNEHLHLFNDSSMRLTLEKSGLRVQAIEHYLWRKRSNLGSLLRLPFGLVRTALQGAPQYVSANDGMIAFAQK
ncbi:MAG: class I SAM-dependent methyltransferase [Candidatus Kapabacteria bacterium]|nr:class I SAM-dependent methyltransferase [Candidatus Kapabacteria bacterium]